jgi:bacterioferritin-associated ferredoxin
MECLQTRLRVATCCGRCAECAQRMLNDASVARFNEQQRRAA